LILGAAAEIDSFMYIQNWMSPRLANALLLIARFDFPMAHINPDGFKNWGAAGDWHPPEIG